MCSGKKAILIWASMIVMSLVFCSCSIVSFHSKPSSQGSVGSCHSFVVASIYEEKLKREGLQVELSQKDLFLRVFFQGVDERQEILRQLTMSVDRKLPKNYHEGSSLNRVADQVKRYGVLNAKDEPYVHTFKSGLPMQMKHLRHARMTVNHKASVLKKRLGRSLTRAEKATIVDAQFALLQKQGVIDALCIKEGDRSVVRRFAANFEFKQARADRSLKTMKHIVTLLHRGSVGAGLSQYPWAGRASRYSTSGHAVVLRDYDPATGEFVISNPWWLRSFGAERHDRIAAMEFMSYLETYVWLQDNRPAAMRKAFSSEVTTSPIAMNQHSSSRATTTEPEKK